MRSSHSLADIEGSPWSAIRKNWTILTHIAAGVMTVVATIVTPPPTPIGTLGIRPFASFVVAILAGIFLLVLGRFRKQAYALWLAALTAILLAVTVVDYFWYFNLIDTRTEIWHERTIVCGTELRPEIQNKYGSTIRKSRVRQLLDDATGNPQLIWTDQSIRWSKDILGVSYLVIVPLIGGCIMAASQIAMCRALPRPAAKPAKANKQKSPVHSS
jgi:hypothetical protein